MNINWVSKWRGKMPRKLQEAPHAKRLIFAVYTSRETAKLPRLKFDG
jgi:hypothetical protein